jgi:signal transduction histidine kinase
MPTKSHKMVLGLLKVDHRTILYILGIIGVLLLLIFVGSGTLRAEHRFKIPPSDIKLIVHTGATNINMPTADEEIFNLKSQTDFPSRTVHQYTYRFEMKNYTKQPTTAFLSAAPINTQLFFNGISLDVLQYQNMALPGLADYMLIAEIPSHYYHPGINTLGVVLTPSGDFSNTGDFYLGPKLPLNTALERFNSRNSLLPIFLRLISVLILITSTLNLVFSKVRMQEVWMLFIGGVTLIWYLPMIGDIILLTGSRAAILVSALQTSIFCMFCLTRTGEKRQVQIIIFSAFIITAAFTVWAIRVSTIGLILPWVFITVILPALLYTLWCLVRFFIKMQNHWESALYLTAGLSLIPILLYGVPTFSPARLSPSAPWLTSYLLVLLPLCISLISGTKLIKTIQNYQGEKNRMQLQITETGNRLTEKEMALQSETRIRVRLEERQRLSRDMHDGIGGQLLSLLMRVRSGQIGMQQVEGEIEDGINDLRLIVDSMDQNSDDLLQVMATFRSRTSDQLDASGIKMEWKQSERIYFKSSGTRMTLNIYRFLQEAVSNTVRHANAKHMQISFRQNSSDEALVITIKDDGRGIEISDIKHSAGKGLKNMRARAKSLGGKMTIGPGVGGQGVAIELTLLPT